MADTTATPAQIVKRSLLTIGAVDRDKALTGTELNDGVDSLNVMLASWSQNKLKLHAISKESFTLVVGQASYTMGPSGADFTTDRPMDVLAGFVRSGDNIDYPLEKMTRNEYNDVVAKGDTGRAYRFYYHPTATDGTLYLDYTPSTAETIFLDLQKGLGNFTAPDTAITLPANYIEALTFNLALRLAPEYGMIPSEEVKGLAGDTLSELKALNSEQFVADLEYAIASYPARTRGGFGF